MSQTTVSSSIYTPSPDGLLSDKQLAFFKAFGFIVLRQLFRPEEVKTIRREFDHAMHEQYAHRPYDGKKRHWTMMLEGDTPLFSSLMEDPRFLKPTKQMYGEIGRASCRDGASRSDG